MIRLTCALATGLLAAATSASSAAQAPPPSETRQAPMSLEQQMLLRCSAAFAIVAGEQQRGTASGRAYPPLGERGKEFFVRAGARLMDELKLSREQVQNQLRAEAQRLQSRAGAAENHAASLAGVMPPCLAALDATGL